MNDLRLVRGRDVKAYIDQASLYGVTELDVSCKKKYHSVYEYLSSEPQATLPAGDSYQIRLKTLSLFSFLIPLDRTFVLSIRDEDVLYIFEPCRVVQRDTEVQGNENTREVFQIEAKRMREQVIDDE